MPLTINRPTTQEYPDYYQHYIDLLPEGDILTILENQAGELQQLLSGLSDKQAEEAYAPGKWTIKELLQHMLDSERVFSYRALCFSRREEASLPAYEENSYAANSEASTRTLSEMLEEYDLLRRANLLMFRSFTTGMLDNFGVANGKRSSLRGIIHVIAAHERHHMQILKERYLQVV